ncbi:MAG: hypothetical protein ACLQSR_14020 [Limisphaerales bacterium]
MGTERNQIRNISCLCGKGRITVTFCSPDHAYAHDRQTWREDKIECGNCEAKYTIVEQGKNLVLVSHEDCELGKVAEMQKKQELKDLEKCLWENLGKNGELGSVVIYLNGFKTASAADRCLSDLYVYRDLADLRKKFPKESCTVEHVKRHIYPRALEKLLIRMKTPSKILNQYFEDDSQVRNRPLPIPRPIGEPILHLNR